MSLAVLYRQVFQVKPSNWKAFTALEDSFDKAEAKAGHPVARRYRPFVSVENSGSRVYERIYESFADFGKLSSERYLNKELSLLDAKRLNLTEWVRNELYYVDSGAPIPKWMSAISRKPFTEESLKCGIPRKDSFCSRDKEPGKVKIMYRQIQFVPKDRWAEKFEMERNSDEVELAQGNPLPIRLRVMYGNENSHIRVSEREYDCYESLCKLHEDFVFESSKADAAVMDAEAKRQDYFVWEKEELYYVD